MLEYRHVCAAYHKKEILHNLSISFPQNQITAIIGPNGCGKSTLARCLTKQVQLTAGEIYLDDHAYFTLSLKERAKKISIFPQIRVSIPSISSGILVENGRFPYSGLFQRKTLHDKAIIRESMEFTHTLAYYHTNVEHLSGGERQRVFFAMTLAQDSKYIFMDEPTTYLDVSYQHEFLQLVQLLKKQGKTIILILHDLAQAIQYSDYLIVMNQGKIAGFGTPEECLKQKLIEKVFGITYKQFQDQDGIYIVFCSK